MEKEEEKVVDVKDEAKVEPKDETKAKADTEKTAEELKAEAEALEAEVKELKEKGQNDEYKTNQLIRLEKARAKKEALLEATKEVKKSDEVDTRDLITLAKLDIAEDSEKAKILAKYKNAGLINSYSEGLNNIAIKAEFEALDAENTAKTVIDENNKNSEGYIKTSKEIVNGYRTSGEVPADPKAQEIIAEDSLKRMGL